MKTNRLNKAKKPVDIWRVHTPKLLQEILQNPGTSTLSKPLNIFGRILFDVGEAAARINDPELNKLMIRLCIYEIADPDSPIYDPEKVNEILEA